MKVKGKKIWITGASSGLGEALAYACSVAGAQLVLSSRNIEKLEAVKNNCTHPDAVMVQELDVASEESRSKAVKVVLQHFGGVVDILINSAGISQRSRVKDTPLEIDRKIMEINYFGTIALTKAVLPGMLQQGSGQIVAISSVVGKIGTPLRSAYASSKHALHGFFDSLRAESGKDGIQVTIICPGYITTNISLNAVTADGSPQNKMDAKTAAGMSPEQFARKALRAIERDKQEVLIGSTELLAVYVKRFFPRLLAYLVSRVKVT